MTDDPTAGPSAWTSPDPIPPAVAKWLDLKLEEYRALRAEVTTSITTQQSILSFGTATVALVFGPGLGLWDKATELSVSLIFSGLVPLLSALVLVIWWGEVLRMVRAGEWLAHVEEEIGKVGETRIGWAENPLGWECYLREPGQTERFHRLLPEPYPGFPYVRQFVINIRGVLAAFWAIALASLGLGVFHDNETGGGIEASTWALTSGSLLVLVASGAFMTVRWRAERAAGKKRLDMHRERERL